MSENVSRHSKGVQDHTLPLSFQCVVSGRASRASVGAARFFRVMKGIAMKVRIEEVKSYKITSEDGSINLGVFTEQSEWNGMVDLRSVGAQQVIVEAAQPSFFPTGIFRDAEPRIASVFKISPSLIEKLTPTPQPPDHPPEAGSPESPRPHC